MVTVNAARRCEDCGTEVSSQFLRCGPCSVVHLDLHPTKTEQWRCSWCTDIMEPGRHVRYCARCDDALRPATDEQIAAAVADLQGWVR